MNRNEGINLPESLYAILHEDRPTPWSMDEIKATIAAHGDFKSGLISYILRTGGTQVQIGSRNTPSETTSQPTQSLQLPIRDLTAQNIINLGKLYSNDQKYSGIDDSFDFKLTIFLNYCTQLNIDDDTVKAKAYSIMLKETALQHYLTNLNSSGLILTFIELCNKTRDYFENDEYRRSRLVEFNSITLTGVITDPKNQGKSVKECLAIIVTELRRLQSGLDTTWRIDMILHQRLIDACQPVPACQYACAKPSTTLPGLINDLQSSIDTWGKSHPSTITAFLASQNQVEDDEFETFYTDRRFHRNNGRYTPSRFNQ